MDKATRSWKTTKTIFQLQGNIASGKSELLTILQDKGISVAKEPLEEWAELLKISEKEGGKDFSVHKQTRILSSLSLRDSETRQTLVSKDKVVMERDIVSSKEIFVPYATGNNRMDKEGEMTIRLLHKNLENLRNLEDRNWEERNDCRLARRAIYLRTPPEECWGRIKQRGQVGDSHLTQEQISQLHTAHETWVKNQNKNIFVINGDDDQMSIANQVMDEINKRQR